MYTADYLTKKLAVNHGEIPQYYVEDCHEAIIEPAQFDLVQDVIAERSKRRHSGVSIFSSKIRCGECGNWYGSKVWHSTDQYRRVIWRCNAKYKDKGHRCGTPHLTEDEIRDAFVRMVNKLTAGRGTLLADLRDIQATYSGTADLDARLQELDERLNHDAEAVQELIDTNARVAQNQDDYNVQYDELVSRYESTKAERDSLAAEIRQRGIRRRELGRFIKALEKMPEAVTEFDEALWGSLIDHVTVYSKDDIRFTLVSGAEFRTNKLRL